MAVETLTKPLDRWDLIAERVYGVPDLAWAIAEANPTLANDLILPAGITLNIPEINTLRRPLTAANPAREDDGEFLPLPADDSPAPIPTGGGVVGNYVPLEAVGVTVAPLFNGVVPIGYLPAYPTLASLNGLSAEAINTALASKVDVSTYNTAIALKADASAVATALGLKADVSAVNTALGLKADASALTAGLASKIDTAARNAANGVAGLDGNSLISAAQIPPSVQFQLIARTSPATVDLNSLTQNHASLRFIDGAAHSNLPGALTGGSLLQYDALFGVSAGTVKFQTMIGLNGRVYDRVQSTTWLSWNERAYLNGVQPFTTVQDFNAAARFKSGGIPAITTSLTQAGVDASGQPILWMVNAAATTGNRLKSISISSNGNIRLTHHADDGASGIQVELTASGNLLTVGTVRPGSGSTAFTGAQFVPGAMYFRSDLAGDSGTGSLTYSDGTTWRRVGDGSLITETPTINKIVKSTTAATQSAAVLIPHGITGVSPGSRITAISGVVRFTTGGTVVLNSIQPNYQTWVSANDTHISITNVAANSAAILSMPVDVYITYTL